MADTAYERVLCVKNEVLVYKIPPRPSNRGYRADDWKLDSPDWTGRLRVLSMGRDLFLKLEDKNSGELFASCPVETFPSVAIEPVMDSSRYFVIRIKDPSGRSAFIGIGFHDRADSFDLNVSVQDHFKQLKQEKEAKVTTEQFNSAPKLDLGFKSGQTITLNLGANAKPRTKPAKSSGGGLGFLPPPPGGAGRIPPPSAGHAPAASVNTFQAPPQSQGVDFLQDLGSSAPVSQPQPPSGAQPDLWGDFTGAAGNQPAASSADNWVNFG